MNGVLEQVAENVAPESVNKSISVNGQCCDV